MGLFDTYKAKPAEALSQAEAILSVTVAAIAADGAIDDEEVTRIKMLAFISSMFGHDFDEIPSTVVRVAKYNNRVGVAEAIKQAKVTLPAELRETAFS